METSLRYGGDSSALKINKTPTSNNKKGPQTVRYASDASGSALKIYAKQKFHFDSNTRLQVPSFLPLPYPVRIRLDEIMLKDLFVICDLQLNYMDYEGIAVCHKPMNYLGLDASN
ncbi:hypothetical protein Hanom_Chr05g00425321 [Helianthus anomalus]